MKDEIISEQLVKTDSYTSRKGQTYEELGTSGKDWQPCRIIGYEFIDGIGDVPVYEIPKDYLEVTTRFTTGIDFMGYTTCRLCGAGIRRHHYIQCDSKQLLMLVGSECVHNHYGQVVLKKIKQFKDNETRIAAKKFLEKYIEWAPTQKAFAAPKDSWQARMIKESVYRELIKAQKMLNEFDKQGVRKLKNFMIKNKEFETIPPVRQIQEEVRIRNVKELVFCLDNKIERQVEFGRYKGKYLAEIPEDYKKWCKEESLR